MNDQQQGRQAPTGVVPYNTGKVLIGSRYEPPRKYQMSRDAEIIQAAFLGHRRYPIKVTKTSIAALAIFAVAALLWVTR